MRRRRTILGAIDHPLGMFNAHAHGKGLLGHSCAQIVDHLKGIPGAVAHGQDHILRIQHVLARAVRQHGARHPAFTEPQARQPGFKPHVAAQDDDLLPDTAHHAFQIVRADMGLGFPQDFLRRARAPEFLQHGAAAGILDAAVQLAV